MRMDWIKLKIKFPNSELEIREHLEKTKIKDSRLLIEDFLNTKGFDIKYGFIKELRIYESTLSNKNRTRTAGATKESSKGKRNECKP